MDHYICPKCKKNYAIKDNVWECTCGSVLELPTTPVFSHGSINKKDFSLWRYAKTLPIQHAENIVSLGEGFTPLIPLKANNHNVLMKLEYTNPSGSYKDRGATVLVSALKEAGIKQVVDDSSGNAGASLAAYTAYAGMECHIYVPASNSGGKLKQISAYGARVVAIEGSRNDTSLAVLEAGKKTYYASHAHSPLFMEGCKTIAYELWEQMDPEVPEMVIAPLGQGAVLLGLFKGFKELKDQGYIEQIPRLVGVQSEACAPIARAFEKGLNKPVVVEAGETIAEGIKLARPLRGEKLLDALRSTQGDCVAVSDEKIIEAKKELSERGFYVEPTSATAMAGYHQIMKKSPVKGKVVLILTGSGLKSV